MLVRSRVLASVALVPLLLELAPLACAPHRGADASGAAAAGADAGDAQGGAEAAGDGEERPCRLRPWAPPRRVEVVSTPLEEGAPSLTPDELSIVFHARRSHDDGARYELWTAKRATRTSPFSAPERIAAPGSDADDAYPTMISDGLTLMFASRRLDASGPYRLFRAERPDVSLPFEAAVTVPSPDDAVAKSWPAGSAVYPSLTPDRTALHFSVDQGGDDFYRVYRADLNDIGELGAPVREESVDDAKSSLAFVLSADRLTLLVSRGEEDGLYRIHSAVRASVDEPFGPLAPVDALNEGAVDARVGWLSPDGCRAYLARRDASDDVDVYTSERQP